METRQMQRREFIKTAAMAAGLPFTFGGCRSFRGNSKIHVAIIGCGRISTEFEVPGVLNRPDIARIVAVCDLDMKRARQTAEHVEREYADGTKIRIYKDYKEVCSQSDVDAVMICVPDFWHALVATTAICSRKAVWLQKPFANGKFSLNANLAEYGLNFDQGMGGIRDGSFDTVRSA